MCQGISATSDHQKLSIKEAVIHLNNGVWVKFQLIINCVIKDASKTSFRCITNISREHKDILASKIIFGLQYLTKLNIERFENDLCESEPRTAIKLISEFSQQMVILQSEVTKLLTRYDSLVVYRILNDHLKDCYSGVAARWDRIDRSRLLDYMGLGDRPTFPTSFGIMGRRGRSRGKSGICFAYQRGNCRRNPCRFQHSCQHCGHSGHSANNCYTNQVVNL